MDDHALSDRAASAPASALEEAREHYLLLLLGRFEAGKLECYEYFRRVHMVESATSLAAMAEFVDAPLASPPDLDPVDMLLLSRQRQTQDKELGGRRPRWWWIAVMAFFFLVLLMVGIWLVAHARQLRNSGNLGTVAAVSTASAQVSSPASPPSSVRSSRR
ncbi:MAG TPA: hypothetical protein VK386_01115 [Acidimicrobiales bacterium]|nr:hypothetical protein [Acidimicrobiales bacterium]